MIGGSGPQITNQPDSVVVAPGTNVDFSVGATGSSLKYQWRFNSTNIAGATASAYSIASVDLTNAGNYSVIVTNSTGANTSSFAYLSVTMPPTNAPGSIVAPTGMVNWWDGQGDTTDTFGPLTGVAHGNFFYAPGQPGFGFHFDGSTSYLTTGAASLAVPWTLSLWVNRQNSPNTSAALLSDGTYSFKLEQYNGTRAIGITRFGVADYNLGYVVPQNTWTHVAMVGTSGGTALYINGALQTSVTNSEPLPRAYLGVSYLTSNGAITDYLLATLDEVATFNRALSAGEISAIYAAGNAGWVRAPEFTSMLLNGNTAQIDTRGIPAKGFTIYRTTDFTDWSPIYHLSSPSGTLEVFDSVNGAPQYFYKATQP